MVINKIKRWLGSSKRNENVSGIEKRRIGYVRFINHTKNYGFISMKNSDKNAILNLNEASEKINPGDKVKFTLVHQKNRYLAKNVSLV